MTEQNNPSPSYPAATDRDGTADSGDGVDFLDLAIVVAKHKWTVLALPAIAGAVAIILSGLMTPIYTATTKILPPQQSQSSASAFLAQLGGIAGLAGGAGGFKNPNDIYVGMLKSRTVADGMIERFDLKRVYEQDILTTTRSTLAGQSDISVGKDGIISIDVDDKDAKRAADLANGYVDELLKLTKTLAVTEGSQRRLFFERQLLQAKDNLAKAESAARIALDRGGIVKVDEQGRSMVETTARLRAQISVKEVQISAMRSFAADANPELQKAQLELDALKREAAKFEGTDGGAKTKDPSSSAKGIDNLSLLRDLKYYETIYELLAKQFELAKIDEAKDSSVVQVMDKAIAPERKSKPARIKIVLFATAAALFAGILWAFVAEAVTGARRNPLKAERLHELSRYLAWRRTRPEK